MANEIIGHWRCDAGGQADVMQTKRRGHHLYTRCDCCGLDQRTKSARQTKLWGEAQFFAGVTVKKPSNVTEQAEYVSEEQSESQPELPGPQTESRSHPEPDFDPSEGSEKPEPDQKGRDWPRLVAGLALVGSAVGGWLWTNR